MRRDFISSLIEIPAAAAVLGRKGGKTKTEAKAAAARTNGAKGGRPRKTPAE